jgi:hypothetical protein
MSEPTPDADYVAFQEWKAAQAKVAEAVDKPVEYYVHLADGSVDVMPEAEAEGTHVDGVAVIGKYQVGV